MDELQRRKTQLAEKRKTKVDQWIEVAPDQLFVAGKMRNIFKRTQSRATTWLGYVTKIVEIPLNLLRDYTVPMAEVSDWSRNRAAILPLTIPVGFCLL